MSGLKSSKSVAATTEGDTTLSILSSPNTDTYNWLLDAPTLVSCANALLCLHRLKKLSVAVATLRMLDVFVLKFKIDTGCTFASLHILGTGFGWAPSPAAWFSCGIVGDQGTDAVASLDKFDLNHLNATLISLTAISGWEMGTFTAESVLSALEWAM